MNDKAKDTEEVAVAPLRRVAIVTGASRGIGAAIAQRLALEGYSVVLNYASDGSTEAACALCAELSDFADTEAQESLALEVEQAAEPQRFIAVQADVSRFDEAKRLINEVKQQFGRIDVLVNNAGFGYDARFVESDMARQRELILTNDLALVELVGEFAPDMAERKCGGILNVASVAGFMPGPDMATYYASKAFVQSFSQAIHVELRRAGVHVSTLCPGPVRTAFWENADAAHTPISRIALDAPFVASEGFNALCRNKALCVPGALAKTIVFATRLAPRGFVARTAAALQRPRKKK